MVRYVKIAISCPSSVARPVGASFPFLALSIGLDNRNPPYRTLADHDIVNSQCVRTAAQARLHYGAAMKWDQSSAMHVAYF